MKSKKRYYLQNIEGLNHLVETPESKARTEKTRFIISIVISSVSAIAAIAAAVFAYISAIAVK